LIAGSVGVGSWGSRLSLARAVVDGEADSTLIAFWRRVDVLS
jgi:hypothetical protein